MSKSRAQSSRVASKTETTSGTAIHEARLTVDDADLAAAGIGDLLSLWRDAGLRDFDILSCGDTGAVVQFRVESEFLERELAAPDCVDRWAHVSERPDGHLYVVEFTAPLFPPSLAVRRPELLDNCDPELHDDGLDVSLLGSMESVTAAIEYLGDGGLSPVLLRIGSYTGRDGPLDALTERQREVITTAYELGYYEVPRAVSADDLAAELGVDASTVAEHLQRAERNLFGRHLSS